MAARDCDGIGRGNTEHVIKARVMNMIFDAMESGLDAASAGMSETAEAAEVPDDLVVNGDDVIEIQQISGPSARSERPGVR